MNIWLALEMCEQPTCTLVPICSFFSHSQICQIWSWTYPLLPNQGPGSLPNKEIWRRGLGRCSEASIEGLSRVSRSFLHFLEWEEEEEEDETGKRIEKVMLRRPRMRLSETLIGQFETSDWSLSLIHAFVEEKVPVESRHWLLTAQKKIKQLGKKYKRCKKAFFFLSLFLTARNQSNNDLHISFFFSALLDPICASHFVLSFSPLLCFVPLLGRLWFNKQ